MGEGRTKDGYERRSGHEMTRKEKVGCDEEGPRVRKRRRAKVKDETKDTERTAARLKRTKMERREQGGDWGVTDARHKDRNNNMEEEEELKSQPVIVKKSALITCEISYT